MNRNKRGFDVGDFEITKREILASISIIAVMLLVGVLISGVISEHQMDKNEIYNKAAKIESKDLFQYGMNTNVGNAFVYGKLKAVDTVTYPEIGGEYMYVEKVKEKYIRHTRTVTYKDSDDKTHTRTEVYWSWDRVGNEHLRCKEISFCGVTFDSGKLKIPSTNYIRTIRKTSRVRYKYYGTKTEYKGTIFTNLNNKTIPDNTEFYNGMNIEEAIKRLESSSSEVIFWIVWIILIVICVFWFYYKENKWLD